MSEYQRYEFMTIDQPLTRAQRDEVMELSSHIEATSSHALIEYNWGNFKHDPIEVLREFFDGLLYWANWGSPRLALRFPHGILSADLLSGYDLDDFVTFTPHPDYDILDIHFGEMESPSEWIQYELEPLIAIRDELMEGDLRALYIVWLAGQITMFGYDEAEEEDYEISVPPVPPAFGSLSTAQQALAELLQIPEELLVATARHSKAATPSPDDDFATRVKLLPPDRCHDYLVQLAHNKPGLSRQLVRELRELDQNKSRETLPEGELVTYATLLAESKRVKAQMYHEEFERQQAAHLRRLQDIHDQQETCWHQVNQAALRGTGAGYDEALRLLVELSEAADHFQINQKFQERFRTWVQSHKRRPALIKRLQDHNFPLPEM